MGKRLRPSPQQEFTLFLHSLIPRNYVILSAFEIEGDLNRAILAQSLDSLVVRHDSLRMFFPNAGEVCEAEITPETEARWPIEETDLRHLSATERDRKVEELLNDLRSRPFDLQRGPLLRGAIIRCDSDRWILGLAVDHIVFDGRSREVLLAELQETYAALVNGRRPAMAETPSITQVIAEEWRFLSSETGEKRLRYWVKKFADRGPFPPELPWLSSVGDDLGARGHTTFVEIPISATLVESVDAATGALRASSFMIFFSALMVAIRPHLARDEFGFGTIYGGRLPRRSDVVGFFGNATQVLLNIPANADVYEVLPVVRTAVLETIANSVPMWRLVLGLQGDRFDPNERLPAGAALRLDVPWAIFQFDLSEPSLELPGLQIRWYSHAGLQGFSPTPVVRFSVSRSRGGYRFMCEFPRYGYHADLLASIMKDALVVLKSMTVKLA